MKKVDEEQLARIKWQCRRGTLELDCLLDGIIENHYPFLSYQEKTLLESLLTHSDEELTRWLILKETSRDFLMDELIKKF